LVGCTVAPGFDFADFELLSDHGDAAILSRNGHPAVQMFY
jgi:predicted cupin superfamily sugar epimerase